MVTNSESLAAVHTHTHTHTQDCLNNRLGNISSLDLAYNKLKRRLSKHTTSM